MTSSTRRPFPLVPRPRLAGGAYGIHSTARRGQGSDVATSRLYRPGDRLAWIDWKNSARLSAVQDKDQFIVREHFAQEAPRVVVLVDQHPAMDIYSDDLPWLSKRAALSAVLGGIAVSARAARAELGYLDYAGLADRGGAPFWLPPSRSSSNHFEDRLSATFDAPPDTLSLGLAELIRRRHDAPSGCFVFVISDFLRPPAPAAWARARRQGWDLVPVIVQDPTWEQSFPPVGGSAITIQDPVTGAVHRVRLSARETSRIRDANVARLAELVRMFRALDSDPVVVGTSDEREIDRELHRWATRRRLGRRAA